MRCRAARDQAWALDTEVEGFRRSIGQEEERNEQLTVALNAARLDCGTSRKLLARGKAQEEALLAQHATYTRTLQESERRLEQVTAVSPAHAPAPPTPRPRPHPGPAHAQAPPPAQDNLASFAIPPPTSPNIRATPTFT